MSGTVKLRTGFEVSSMHAFCFIADRLDALCQENQDAVVELLAKSRNSDHAFESNHLKESLIHKYYLIKADGSISDDVRVMVFSSIAKVPFAYNSGMAFRFISPIQR